MKPRLRGAYTSPIQSVEVQLGLRFSGRQCASSIGGRELHAVTEDQTDQAHTTTASAQSRPTETSFAFIVPPVTPLDDPINTTESPDCLPGQPPSSSTSILLHPPSHSHSLNQQQQQQQHPQISPCPSPRNNGPRWSSRKAARPCTRKSPCASPPPTRSSSRSATRACATPTCTP